MGNLCKRSDVLSAWLVISALGISMLACSIFSPASPTPTIALPTDTPSGPCEATAPAEVTIYMRPDPAAERRAAPKIRAEAYAIDVDLGLGKGSDYVYFSDLGIGYVKLNSGYRT